MKKKLCEMKCGERFFQFPASPIRKFMSLEFVQTENAVGYWELITEEAGGQIYKHVCTKEELEEEWNVLS